MVEGWTCQSWSGQEGEALMNGICALIKKPHRASSPLPPCEHTLRCLQPGRGPLPNHAGPLISDFWPPEVWEINQFLLFIGYAVSGILLQQPRWMKHFVYMLLEFEFLESKRHILFIKFLFIMYNTVLLIKNEVSTYYVQGAIHTGHYTIIALGYFFNEHSTWLFLFYKIEILGFLHIN